MAHSCVMSIEYAGGVIAANWLRPTSRKKSQTWLTELLHSNDVVASCAQGANHTAWDRHVIDP